MPGPFGATGTGGSTRLAGTIPGAGPPTGGTWELLDLVIDASAAMWICTGPGQWQLVESALSGGGTISGGGA